MLCATLLSLWGPLPWPATAALALLGTALATVTLRPEPGPGMHKLLWLMAGGSTALLAATLLVAQDGSLKRYHGVTVWLVAIAAFAGALHPRASPGRSWCRRLAVVWGFLGATLWVGACYLENLEGLFFLGLAIFLILLVLCHGWLRLPGWGFQLVNTCILFTVGLPIVDEFLEPAYRSDLQPDPEAQWYSYEKAKGDPAAFKQWWNYYQAQWASLAKAIASPDHTGFLPYRVRPGSRGVFFKSSIAINSLGFRGKPIPRQKGPAYRIVALGESTTFGCTLRAQGRPWPELLEQMIRQRLQPHRPVEVINAGLPAYDLRNNLYRLRHDILSLQPDLIISYHGLNGFHLLDESLPSLVAHKPPEYQPRPLKLLANCEYHLKLWRQEHLQNSSSLGRPPASPQVMDSSYARAYRDLIALAQTNGIHLALANYSMAVNSESDLGVVGFYLAGFPLLPRLIQANALHTQLLQQLGHQYPQVCLIDTQVHLDGEHGKFIDLVHFTQEGRQQLAENIFAGLEPLLRRDLFKADPEVPQKTKDMRNAPVSSSNSGTAH